MNKDERIVLTILILAIATVLSIWILRPTDFESCLKFIKEKGRGECSYGNNNDKDK